MFISKAVCKANRGTPYRGTWGKIQIMFSVFTLHECFLINFNLIFVPDFVFEFLMLIIFNLHTVVNNMWFYIINFQNCIEPVENLKLNWKKLVVTGEIGFLKIYPFVTCSLSDHSMLLQDMQSSRKVIEETPCVLLWLPFWLCSPSS